MPALGGRRWTQTSSVWVAARTVAVAEEYEFRVKGRLSTAMLEALDELEPRSFAAETVLTGHAADAAQLHGLIGRFESLGLELTEVRRLPHSMDE
jgi:hypothetical protein